MKTKENQNLQKIIKGEIKNMKKQGISLITLVITIIIMIILAGAIILTLTQSGIFDKANDAVSEYSLKQVQAIADLAWSEAYADGVRDKATLQDAVDKALEDNELDDKYKAVADEKGVIVKVKSGEKPQVGKKFEENGTIDGNEWSATNPIIPAGFIPINTSTSKWNEGNLADNVKNGLVITDEVDSNGNSIGNEFVWIPVETISEFAETTTVNGSDKDINGRTNYKGVLYDLSTGKKVEGPVYDEEGGYEHYYEPGILTEPHYDEHFHEIIDDIRDSADKFTVAEIKDNWDELYYQEQFNKMVECVEKYNGFYISRYELSENSTGELQSKAGMESKRGIIWWEFYEKIAVFDNKKSGVITEMMWGCQHDAMLRWMESNNINISSLTPFDTARGVNATANETKITGAEDSNDILNNVYDILGNSSEFTQEKAIFEPTSYGYAENCRGGRGAKNTGGYLWYKCHLYPTSVPWGSYASGRMTLCVE